ncbi:hypothetical protein [Nannocystis sp. SCPEA4]|uniref:hypothetical protein n=1 Tax=Nannocystis sp. SCPEA4 TaxID=2996787 RepID=UPI0022721345|nr:hypothetical protein [Nannocystis sp. SCPEA4]MCY1054603.1 hypothetical protein [Nannocystis sp. SCPEA4]
MHLVLVRRSSALVIAVLTACGDAGGNAASDATGASSDADTTATTTLTTDTTSTTASGEQPTGEPGTEGATGTGTTSTTTTTTSTTTDATSDALTSTTSTTSDATSTTTTDATSTTTTDATSTTTTDTTTGGDSCLCPDIEIPLDDGIFVLSDDSELWKYRPDPNTFESLGAVDCGLMPKMHSMAVDREGFAWMMFKEPKGALRKVDVTNPQNCSDPGYVPGQMGIEYFGMAFVSNNANDACDRLYGNSYKPGFVDEAPGIGDLLGVDPDTLLIDLIGETDYNGGELTGTGDGRLFLFSGANPAKLLELDKSSGAVLATLPLVGFEKTYAFAVAFFAGDFYFFTESGGYDTPSKVTRLDYDDSDNNGVQDLVTVNPMGPIRIVGAGVSTCAPFLPM